MYMSLMLGDGVLAAASETFYDLDQKISSHYLVFGDSVQAFIAGLAAFQVSGD